IGMWGLGAIPACWLDGDFFGGSGPTTGCAPVELTIRQSFRKVTDTDYEPQDWDGYRFQSFGAFTTERKGYNRNYGMTDTQWHRFINRYNIWERSHYYADPVAMTGEVACFTPATTPAGTDPHRDVLLADGSQGSDGTEDECQAVGGGSRCDTFKQKCTLPYKDRVVKPVVWYYAEGSHPDFFAPTLEATIEWDVALRAAAMSARYAECNKTGAGDCAAKFPVYSGQQDDNQDLMDLAKEVQSCRAGIANGGADCEAFAATLGADRGYAPAVIATAQLQPAIVLCHSPVEAADPAACAPTEQRLPAGTTAAMCADAEISGNTETLKTCRAAKRVRRGDLRYHQVNGMRAPQTPSPWGIMVDSNDPLTGEVVAASINVWTHVNDLWSQGIVDTARFIKGELTTQDVTEGTYVRDWAGTAENMTRTGVLERMTKDDADQKLADAVKGDKAALKANLKNFKKSEMGMAVRQHQRQVRDIAADVMSPSTTRPTYEARRQRALGTPTEAALITRAFSQLATNGNSKVDVSQLTDLTSPLRRANPSVDRNFRNLKEVALADRGACVMNEHPAPFAIADLAGVLEAKFGNFDKSQGRGEQLVRAERMRKYLAQRAHYAVIAHEMGHSIGLRHNFVSSSDATNYRPQYWQLRTDNGSNTAACTSLDTTGACVGPRWFDPVTTNEKQNLIGMFMHSSTMDYAGEAAQDALGLGAYDFAAARMFYGDVVSVMAEDDKKAGTPVGLAATDKMDSFGGILGFAPVVGTGDPMNPTEDIHYSQMQAAYGLIRDCKDVDVNKFKPSAWDESKNGIWSPLMDGFIVSVNGQASRCRTIPVDYVPWSSLRVATAGEGVNFQATPAIDAATSRVRWPYGFATDRWADLGNVSVYRHDNGADPYEIFDFLITQQEVGHIFDNYRRNRHTFTVRGAINRQLQRYNEKVRDGAKGLGLMANVYRDFAVEQGYDYESLWPYIGAAFFSDNMLASSVAFDHFTAEMARPQAGNHFYGTDLTGTRVLRSSEDTAGNPLTTRVIIPNGATGYYQNVSRGGRPLENALAETKGEYDSEYTINAGSYYEKAFSTMLMTESVDNFISASRRDFLDARYRAVSLADLFPDGYRRWLGNNLTGDDVLRGARLAASASNAVLTDADRYPREGMGFTQWWRPTPAVCFQGASSLECTTTPANTIAVEPQVGWEQQKFLIAWTLMYLPENAQQTWLNQMGIWEKGADSDPGFQNRIELHLPNGKTYIAKTYGKEVIFGKTVQKGIAARILEWGNELLNRAYVTTATDFDADGTPDWYVPTVAQGRPVVKFDSTITTVNPDGSTTGTMGRPGCNAGDNSQCTCTSNRACLELSKYEEVPFFMRQAMRDYGLADPSMKGIY
ncbi:MAG: zinc-dependent metalloprotease, partial [Myxococcaceae bacterium]|nr:zinc-dependent metalloprotease [Myxococcaceae bacterium]